MEEGKLLSVGVTAFLGHIGQKFFVLNVIFYVLVSCASLPIDDPPVRSGPPSQVNSGCSTNQQATPCSTNQQVTPCSTSQQVTPCSTNQQVTPCSTSQQVTPCSTNQQVNPCACSTNGSKQATPICQSESCKAISKLIQQVRNLTVDPCDNFYEYLHNKIYPMNSTL